MWNLLPAALTIHLSYDSLVLEDGRNRKNFAPRYGVSSCNPAFKKRAGSKLSPALSHRKWAPVLLLPPHGKVNWEDQLQQKHWVAMWRLWLKRRAHPQVRSKSTLAETASIALSCTGVYQEGMACFPCYKINSQFDIWLVLCNCSYVSHI